MTTKPTMTTTISKEITTTVASTPKPTQQVIRQRAKRVTSLEKSLG